MSHNRKIAVIGLGYVGLPVAVAFARSGMAVIGFDISQARIGELHKGHDRTLEVEERDLVQSGLTFTCAPEDLKDADFFIVTVPTPIDEARRHAADEGLRTRTYINERWRLTLWDGYESGECFDRRNNPLEIENLWDSAEHQPQKHRLIEEMLREYIRLGDTAPLSVHVA